MPKASVQKHSFNGGELSPLLFGRQDIDKYATGLDTCFNALTLAQGPWVRRPGTQFQHTTKLGNANTCRLLPFRYTTTQNYILEFGNTYLRWHSDGILVDTATQDAVEDITNADPGVITMTGHAFNNGDRCILTGQTGMEELDGIEFIVANAGVNTVEMTDLYGANIDTTNMSAWSSGGTVTEILEATTPYSAAEVDTLRYTQDAESMYLFHGSYEIRRLTRASATSWTLGTFTLKDGPYYPLNETTTTLGLSGTTGSVTVTASATTGINGGSGFLSTDVGRLIRWKDPAADWTWLEITGHTSTTVVTATIKGPDASATTATVDWRLGLYSDTDGWPKYGTFHEDRLVLAGADGAPARVDMSRSGDYDNFAPSDADETVTDSHAISYSVNADDVNVIRWVASTENALLIGTASAEWVLRPSVNNEAITPSNAAGKRSTKHGSSNVDPVIIDKAALFVQKAGKKLRELAYVFADDGFKAPDMTALAEHITTPGMVELTHASEPQPVVWAVRSDGVLLSFAYERDQNVTAWARHELGGWVDSGGTAIPEVESVATIPASAGTHDEVYVVVKRYAAGAVQRYIEKLTKIWESGETQEDAWYFDAASTLTNSPTSATVKAGIWLEGETLDVYVDGKTHPQVTVTDGSFTLDAAGGQVLWGYSYNSDGVSMPVEAGAADGSAQTKTKRIDRIGFWLLDTLGLKIGPSFSDLDEILVRQWGADYGTPTALFTGVSRENFDGDYDRVGQVYWRADGPFPANLLTLTLQLVTQDDG